MSDNHPTASAGPPASGEDDAVKAASARRENFMYAALERVIGDIERGEVQRRTLTFAKRALTPAAYDKVWCKGCGAAIKQHDDHPSLYHCVEWCGSLDPAPALRAASRVPAAAPPEVLPSDLEWLREMAQVDRTISDYTVSENVLYALYGRILAAVEWCKAQGGNDA